MKEAKCVCHCFILNGMLCSMKFIIIEQDFFLFKQKTGQIQDIHDSPPLSSVMPLSD